MDGDERFRLANAYIGGGDIWIEGVSGGEIKWKGSFGWNFYYKLSYTQCEWDVFLYNPELKRIHYENNYIKGDAEGVVLQKTHIISHNISLYQLAVVEPHSPPSPTTTDDTYYYYLCEPPAIQSQVIETLMKSFSHSSKTSSVVTSTSLIDGDSLYIVRNCSVIKSCTHGKRRWISALSITYDSMKFSLTNTEEEVCGVCKLKNYMIQKGYYRLLFTPTVTSFIINIL